MKSVTNKQIDLQKYALISVFDKTGITEFAKDLGDLGYKIISTGGTAKKLSEARIPVIPVEKITGNPECFDGRMKSISFEIEAGIIYDRLNPNHVTQAKKLKLNPIDIVVCNLYPFEETIKNPQVSLDEAIENIDVGGPTMIRAAAKNFKNVIVVIDPKDYQEIISELQKKDVSIEKRQHLASKAFYHLSFYDSQIAKFFSKKTFPNEITLAGRKALNLRYGENPHQQGCLYLEPNTKSPLGNLQKFWGRDLSLINLTDINAGLESVKMFNVPCAVVIKHNTPCGIALGKSSPEALERAIEADPISAFGGVIVLNSNLDKKTAKIIASFKDELKGNFDIVAVPFIDNDALEILKNVRKSMGIYIFGEIIHGINRQNLKWVDGGFILQTSDDNIKNGFKDWKIVTKKKPNKKQLDLAKIAWKFITRIKSNAVIVVDKNIPMTRGIGSGQTSRIGSTKIALSQAGKYAKGAILASDSFFPFDDSVKLAAKYKIGLIIEQGGSIHDDDSIKAANNANIPMIFTNRRAFWH